MRSPTLSSSHAPSTSSSEHSGSEITLTNSPSNIEDTETTEGRVPVDRPAEVEVRFGRPVAISRERQSLIPYNLDPVPTESASKRVRGRYAYSQRQILRKRHSCIVLG